MAEQQKENNDTLIRANRQIERIESLVDELLADFSIADMSPKERLDAAVKLMSQQGRMLMIRQTCEAGMPNSTTNIILASIQRQMRGEIANSLASITSVDGDE